MARKTKKRVAVIGLGFVGLTTSLGLAHVGCTVVGFDVDNRRMKQIASGRIPFHEPHLDTALAKHLGRRFQLASSLEEAVRNADVIFYCVGTPARANGAADISYLAGAIRSTLAALRKGEFKTLTIKSTVPPGTIRQHLRPLITKAGWVIGEDVGLASNPEFLREGLAWGDFTEPDRIVIGADDPNSFAPVAALYADFEADIFHVSLSTAEFIKSTSNALLATLVSFANEISIVADKLGGINVKQAFQILHRDRRWYGEPARMSGFVFPGCGYGGYCLPKDIAALQNVARSAGFKPQLLRSVIATNQLIKEHFVAKIVAATRPRTRIGVLGLSFKAGSDDVRDSAAADIIKLLLKRGRKRLTAFDPMANETFEQAYGYPIQYGKSIEDVVRRSDVVAVLTAWPEFRQHRDKLRGKLVFDGRYCL